MTYHETPNQTNRLFLYRSEMPEDPAQKTKLNTVLDALSIWGGADVRKPEYLSWEFNKEIPKSTIIHVLKHCGCQIITE